MSKRITLLFIVICLIGLVTVPTAKASSGLPLSQEQVFSLLQEAFTAQTSLTNEFRSYDEVQQILSPYFNEEYMNKFLEENVIKEEQGYIVYGSDFAFYFIPFYSYSEQTKILFDKEENKIFVYEFFESPESGPVAYDDHFEVITLEKINSNWLITELSIEDEAPSVKQNSIQEETENAETTFLTWNPFHAFLLEMDNRTPYFYQIYKSIF